MSAPSPPIRPPTLSRRQFLRSLSAVGLVPLALAACGGQSPRRPLCPPRPRPLPRRRWPSERAQPLRPRPRRPRRAALGRVRQPRSHRWQRRGRPPRRGPPRLRAAPPARRLSRRRARLRDRPPPHGGPGRSPPSRSPTSAPSTPLASTPPVTSSVGQETRAERRTRQMPAPSCGKGESGSSSAPCPAIAAARRSPSMTPARSSAARTSHRAVGVVVGNGSSCGRAG
jgi:hypothetical protein